LPQALIAAAAIEMPEQYMYMMWHSNSELDPGHKWLRQSIMQTIQTNQ
jgi:DNA-binding transcriptional LysR family regulator